MHVDIKKNVMFKYGLNKILAIVASVTLLSSCMIFPARVKMPLITKVVDAESGEPLAGAKLLRIVCDIHDHNCSNTTIDYDISHESRFIKAKGERRWGLYILAPDGLPVPNHNIAIWKSGYYAFVFSQYGNINDIKRHDLLDAINEIPLERRESKDNPNEMFLDGQIKLYRIKGEGEK